MMNVKDWLINNITLHDHDNSKEEFVNGLTHFVGAILSFIGIIFLLMQESKIHNFKIATTIYGLSMLLLFSASTAYHWLRDPILKRIGRILDHSNIYLLIAGTYTPIAFYIGGKMGVSIIIIEWSLTLIGIVFTIKFWGRLKFLHVLLYLIMGWMIILVWSDFLKLVPFALAKTILLGGVLYTIGVIIYSLKKIPYYHGVWHIFVVLGAATMYYGIYKYLV